MNIKEFYNKYIKDSDCVWDETISYSRLKELDNCPLKDKMIQYEDLFNEISNELEEIKNEKRY